MTINPPVVTQWDIDYMDMKLRMNSTLLSAHLYKMSSFNGKSIRKMNSINGTVTSKGLCIITINIVIDTGYLQVLGMLDTGASVSAISQKLTHELSFPTIKGNSDITGFVDKIEDVHSLVNIQIPDIHEEYFHLYPLVDNRLDEKEFKMVLGNDLLKFLYFTRSGKMNTFNLTLDI